MVNNQPRLDHVFAALASTTRRQILSRLEETDGQSVSELANPLGIKLPAMLKQLGVLEDARLITRQKVGRTVHVSLAAAPMAEATAWLQRYRRFWSVRLDRIAVLAEAMDQHPRKVKR
jgi:DNA-binding transcriptional ArsR family regulator